MKVPANTRWILGKGEVQELMKHTRDSAPGPDGIPYSAWSQGGSHFVDILCEAYTALLHHGCVDQDFNINNMAFIPKGDRPQDAAGIAREAK